MAVNADSLNGWFLPVLLALPPEFSVYFDLHQEDQDHSAELLRDGTVLAARTADRDGEIASVETDVFGNPASQEGEDVFVHLHECRLLIQKSGH